MRRYIVERIEGLPPKKDGACSMWNKDNEFVPLINLRKAALAHFNGDPPLAKDIAVSIRVHIGPANSSTIGDLDNFVTGICDGLQAANPRTPLGDRWCEPEYEAIHPRNVVAILDDREVVSIDAKKVIEVIDDGRPWYSLELHGD
jgi:hypothetical protein